MHNDGNKILLTRNAKIEILGKGDEKFTIKEIDLILPNKIVECKIIGKHGSRKINLLTRIDTQKELEYYKAGGILQYVLNAIVNNTA